MKSLCKVAIKSGKNVVLYTETSLEDYIVSSLLNLVNDKSDEEIEKFFRLKDELSEEYYVSVRLCTFNVIEYTPIS